MAPVRSSVWVFFFAVMRADFKPCDAPRSNTVGASTISDLSMYSSLRVCRSKYEFAVIPCTEGGTPQQIPVLLTLVTLGIMALTVL